MENTNFIKFSVAIPLTQAEKAAFDKYCFTQGMKRGGFLRNAILAVIATEKKEAENERK